MNPQLREAINSFIANEYKLDVADLTDPDFNFEYELGLSADQVMDFLSRLQESLGISIPEDKISGIETLGDLYTSVDPEDDSFN